MFESSTQRYLIKDNKMERQREQIDKLFENNRVINNGQQIQLFITQFDSGCDQYCEQKEDQLRQPVESMVDGMVRLIHQYKQMQCSRMQQDDNEQTMIMINTIRSKYDEIVKQSEQIIKQQHNRYDRIMMKHDGRQLEQIKQLRRCEKIIDIYNHNKLDRYKKQIEKYQYDDKQYRIVLNFEYQSFASINSKIRVLKMINAVNANGKVAKVVIRLDDRNKWNDQIVEIMMKKYSNLYSIEIDDQSYQVDDIHEMIKQWVQQQPIMMFELWFYSGCGLYSKSSGLGLMKEYNQLIKQKQYLEELRYNHDGIGGDIYADGKQKIEELIRKVEKS